MIRPHAMEKKINHGILNQFDLDDLVHHIKLPFLVGLLPTPMKYSSIFCPDC
jgi:hypothetical protein